MFFGILPKGALPEHDKNIIFYYILIYFSFIRIIFDSLTIIDAKAL